MHCLTSSLVAAIITSEQYISNIIIIIIIGQSSSTGCMQKDITTNNNERTHVIVHKHTYRMNINIFTLFIWSFSYFWPCETTCKIIDNLISSLAIQCWVISSIGNSEGETHCSGGNIRKRKRNQKPLVLSFSLSLLFITSLYTLLLVCLKIALPHEMRILDFFVPTFFSMYVI